MSLVEPVAPAQSRVSRSSNTGIRRLERRIVLAWKMLTQATSGSRRSSHVPNDFVLVTSRRRSILPPPPHIHARHRYAQSA
ncbi:hypothetical protein JOM56_007575 [Amanita muscaria]